MPGVDRGCTTHHYACDCREAHLQTVEAENARLRAALRAILDGQMGATWQRAADVEIAARALMTEVPSVERGG
jgi:hypothetical protein